MSRAFTLDYRNRSGSIRLVLILTFFLATPTGSDAARSLDWITAEGYRWAELSVKSEAPKEGFTLLDSLAFTNMLSEQRHLTNQILLNGSGVAAGDVDGDGWVDLYFCGLDASNALYRNLRNGKFEEIASAAGVACPELLATGAALVDLDGDGDLDIVVNSVGQGTLVFYNDGTGQFTKSRQVLNQNRGGMSLALGDLDGDGFLDLYVANYRTLGLMDIPNARATFKTVNGKSYVETFNGHPTTSPDLTNRFVVGPRGGIEEQGEPDLLMKNLGGTNFAPFPARSFLNQDGDAIATELFDWGLAVAIRDVNQDGLPDIYVCNDFQTEDRFWIQQRDGKFRLLPALAQRKSSLFSMAVNFADINGDGHDDFFVADMLSRDHSQRMRDMADPPSIYTIGEIANRPQYSLNTLFLNRGDDTYAEIAQLSGVHASEWSWSCVFLDVDLDGWEDILISNGMERAARDLDTAEKMRAMRARRQMSDAEIFQARKAFPRLAPANVAFRNKQDLTFEEVSAKWNFNLPGVSHGIALADLDNDGDLDVVINNLNAPASILRNESVAPRIAIRLKGTPPNTSGVGAKIQVIAEGLPLQAQEMIAGGRYLSSDEPLRTFATGASSEVAVKVLWRSGRTTHLQGLKPNYIYEINEAAAIAPAANNERKTQTADHLFEDVSHLLGHSHAEEPFDDFARQPLLPRKLSQNGPAAAWVDLNNDGWEDLIIGAAKNHQITVFQNDQKGSFHRLSLGAFATPVKRDTTTLLGVHLAHDQAAVVVGLSNYEDALSYGPAVQAYEANAGPPKELVPSWDSAVGPLAFADIDHDGDLDLFAGGSVVPTRYPAPASSRIFRNNNGQFTAIDIPAFREIGLVSSATFCDLDNDQDPDLLLACEWGSIRLFTNEKGVFTDQTERFGLDSYRGLWTGLAIGDFDEDGRPDFVAGNWGRNSKYEAFGDRPIKLFFGDLDEDGTFDLIESHFDTALGKYVPDRQRTVLGGALGFVKDGFRSHAAYSRAAINEILGDHRARAASVEANWFDTTIFLHRGDRFEARSLPIEAQFSPAFGVCVGDFDGDSHEDIVLAQNFFAVAPEVPRFDAGRTLLLKGNGRGDFESIPGQESGLKVYGEQRSVASADFDHDRRLDLVVTQNGAPVKLYRNRRATPGVRVVLQGAPSNPGAVGATVRVIRDGKPGPVRLIAAGSGYQSQDAATQVFAAGKSSTRIEVLWPDGKRTTKDLPPTAKEIRIDYP